MLARTHLSTDTEAAVVRVITLQPSDYVLRADKLDERAEPVRVDSETVTKNREFPAFGPSHRGPPEFSYWRAASAGC